MAFNWQTFRIRTISSFIFMAVMLTGLLWNQWSFLGLFSLIHFGCWWEYLKLTEKIHKTSFHAYTKLGLMVMGYGLMLWFCGTAYTINGYGVKENLSLPVSVAGFTLLLMGIFRKNKISLKAVGTAMLGLLYISLCWGLMLDLYQTQIQVDLHGAAYIVGAAGEMFLPVIIIVSLWMNDTMAYLVGSMIGKTPLTKISPKKTWEGTLGGIILGIAIMIFLFPLVFGHKPGDLISLLGPVSAIVAITGTLGDLLESKLKRMAAVKDSGALLPGHGGYLDRFDSLLIATPFAWLYINFL